MCYFNSFAVSSTSGTNFLATYSHNLINYTLTEICWGRESSVRPLMQRAKCSFPDLFENGITRSMFQSIGIYWTYNQIYVLDIIATGNFYNTGEITQIHPGHDQLAVSENRTHYPYLSAVSWRKNGFALIVSATRVPFFL